MPLRVTPWVSYAKGDVFEVCDVLAGAEAVLAGIGADALAARVAAAFEVMEAGLVR